MRKNKTQKIKSEKSESAHKNIVNWKNLPHITLNRTKHSVEIHRDDQILSRSGSPSSCKRSHHLYSNHYFYKPLHRYDMK